MIKFTTRPNMRYLVHLIIWSFLQDIPIQIIGIIFNCNLELMYVLLVFLGETILGCSLYLYLQRFIRKKSSAKKSNFMSIHLITNDKIKTYDNKYKIYYLIIIAAVFNFIGYIFSLGIGSCSEFLLEIFGKKNKSNSYSF